MDESKNNVHIELADADALISLINSSTAGLVAVVKGQYSPAPYKCERALVYEVGERRLSLLKDCWLSTSSMERVSRSVEVEVSRAVGGCDALFAAPPKHVWFPFEQSFSLYCHCELSLRATADRVDYWPRVADPEEIPAPEVKNVQCFQASSWFQRGVGLNLTDGRELIFAVASDKKDPRDEVFSGVDMIGEFYWTVELGRALAEFLGLELTLDKEVEF